MGVAGSNVILAVDFGSIHTRTLLFDIVDGKYSLVANQRTKTTIGPPVDDVAVGLRQALQEIAAASGRRFFDQRGGLIKPERSDRIGVDYCITTASAGVAIRTVLIGLLPEISIRPSLRAGASFYLNAVAEIHLHDGMTDRARINRIVDSRPDLVLVSGGTDDGARSAMLRMLNLLREAVVAMPAGLRPTVLYAGNNSLAGTVRELLGQLVEVMIAPNIRPTPRQLTTEPLQDGLTQFFHEYCLTRSGAFRSSAEWSDSGILPTARGFETMAGFFGRSLKMDALAIDLGGSKSMLCLATGNALHTVARADVGIAQSAANLLDLVGEDAVERWLPFHPRRDELAQQALKKGLRSASMPLDMRERYIDYALLREGIAYLLGALKRERERDGGRIDLSRLGLVLVAGESIVSSGKGALDMLLLADALQLQGVVRFIADRHGALPALGALSATEPRAVVQLLEGGLIEQVGSLIRATGSAKTGATALKLKIRSANGREISREIAVGDVWHLPAPVGSVVDIRLQTGRGIRVGDKRRLSLQLQGGRGGLLFDARLEALPDGESITERAVNMLRWYAAVTGESQPVMVPESWLAPPEEESNPQT